MAAEGNALLEGAASGLAHPHPERVPIRRLGLRDIAVRPGANLLRCIGGISGALQQVIGIVQRHEALRVLQPSEDLRGVVDPHHFVHRRVQQ